MNAIPVVKSNFETVAVRAGLAVIALHVVNASLFHIHAPLYERVLLALAIVPVTATASYYYPTLGRAGRGTVASVFGWPALLFGLGVHASHVYQVGPKDSDFTGVPMLVAGLVLTVIGMTDLVRSVHAWWRRLLLVPVAVVAGVFIVFPVGLAVFATNVARVPCCEETPADRGIAYDDVSFETEQGRRISAWFIAPENGAVIVTVHGAGSNRATVLDEAEVLVRHGYGVLMFDVEGYGDSEGRANAFGWLGARDVHAGTAYLLDRGVDPDRIGGLGLSMGGEVLLHAAGESDHLKAVVAEGVTGRTRDDFDENPGTGAFIVPFWEVAETAMQLMTGEAPPPPLKDLVAHIAPRRVLLVAAAIKEELDLMGMYLEVGGPSFEMWSIPEARHVGGFDLHPEDYEARVIAFFDDALLGKAAPAAVR